MSKSDVWMPLYIGDYLADTMHLSGPEHGAYVLLLMHSWRTGPLPDNDKALAAIARTDAGAWRRMAATIRAFFVETPAGLISPRLEREREAAATNAERRAAAAAKAAQARWQSDAQRNAPRMPDALRGACPPPSPSPSSPDGEERPPPPPRKRGESPMRGFDQFWKLYPRKIGKGAAERAWPKALQAAGDDPEPILIGLKVGLSLDRFDMREDGRFCPHASTWLNGKRWLDGIEPEPDSQPPLFPQH